MGQPKRNSEKVRKTETGGSLGNKIEEFKSTDESSKPAEVKIIFDGKNAKISIDGEEVILDGNGQSKNRTYDKFKEPEPYASAGSGESPFIVTVYQKPGWKPTDDGVSDDSLVLVQNGKSRNGTYDKYKASEPYASADPGGSPIIVTVYRKPGWKPSQDE